MSSPSSQLTWKLWGQGDIEALHPPRCPPVPGDPEGSSLSLSLGGPSGTVTK